MLNKNLNKTRQANFEIMRIVLMMFVVICHFVVHGFVFYDTAQIKVNISDSSLVELFNYLSLNFVLIISAVAVNCFVLVGGYFLIKSSARWRKVIQIFFQVLFYSVSLSLLFVLFGRVSPAYLLKAVTPIKSNIYWFFTNYIAMMLLAPFLSNLIGRIEKGSYQTLLIILFLLNVNLLFDIPYGSVFGNNGYSLFWFVFLFLVGGYIRLYGFYFESKINRASSFFLLALMFLIYFVAKSLIANKGNSLFFNNYVPYNGFTFFVSVVFFLWMKNTHFNIENIGVKYLLKISPYVFGVYLIHDHPLIRDFLWHELIVPSKYMNTWYLIPLMLFICFIIFIICIFVDIVREYLFMFLKIDSLTDSIHLGIRKIVENVKKYL